MTRHIVRLLLTSSIVALPAAQVHAQEAAPPADETAPQSDGGAAEGDIVVTALRRSSTVQTAPLSIAALTGESLAQTGATALPDYFRQIPNLNLTQGQSGTSRISIRGVNAAGEATTGLYYGETPVTGPSGTTADAGGNAADLNLFDIERVEVLRGPQGTLYGASSMAGTLRVIFNKPDLSTVAGAGEAQVSGTKGGNTGYFAKAMVNVPIVTDVVGVRVSGYYEKRPGYVDNVALGSKNVNDGVSKGVRALLAIEPTPDTNITGAFIYQKTNADDQQGWYPVLGAYKTDSAVKLPFDSKLHLYNVVLNQKFSGVTLTGTASYYRYDILRSSDFTPSINLLSQNPAACRGYFSLGGVSCTPAQLASYRAYGLTRMPTILYQPAYLKSQNYEVRLASNNSSIFQWTVGGYYENRHDHIDSHVTTITADDGSVSFPLPDISYRYVETRNRQTAAFGEVSLNPLEGLTLTSGLRYYKYKKVVSGQQILASPLSGTVPGPYTEASVKSDGLLQKYNVSYRFTPKVMGYVSASQGFRPGGANNVPGLPADLVPYRADSLWNYEAGIKSSWLDNALVFNAAIFQVNWKDMQVQARTADGLFGLLTNAGKARIRGGEVDITARPYQGVTLTGAAGYSDAKLTQDQANSSVVVTGSTGLAGDRIPNVPDWTASASAAYTWAVGDTLNALARVDYAYTGKINSGFRPDTDPYFLRYGSYSTFNARLGLDAENWGVALFVQNIGNVKGITGAVSGLGFSDLSYSITPRTAGITLRGNF